MNPLGAIRRNRFIFGATVALVVSATALLVFTKPSRYRSEAEILVATGYLSGAYGAQVLDVPATTKSQVLVTQTRLASLPAVAMETSRDLGGRFSPAEVEERVSVTGSQDVDIISIVATAAAPQDAEVLATKYAENVVARARQFAGNEIDKALADVRSRLAAYDPESELESLADLREREAQLELLAAGADGGLQIAQTGTPPERIDDFALAQLFLGLLAGLVLGAGASLAADRWNRRIRASDVSARLNAPVLGLLPRPKESPALPSHETSAGEAASLVAVVVDDAGSRVGDKTVVVSSPARREGRTTVAVSLAIALADSGKAVALVEGDMRNPRMGELFAVRTSSTGLASVLRGAESVNDALHHVPLEDGGDGSLWVLPAGVAAPELPGTLLARGELAKAVEFLRERSDYVIIDSPPALDFGDVHFLARSADSLIAAVDERRTNVDDLERLREIADLSNCRIAGAVVIAADQIEVTDQTGGRATADPNRGEVDEGIAAAGTIARERPAREAENPELPGPLADGEHAHTYEPEIDLGWQYRDALADDLTDAADSVSIETGVDQADVSEWPELAAGQVAEAERSSLTEVDPGPETSEPGRDAAEPSNADDSSDGDRSDDGVASGERQQKSVSRRTSRRKRRGKAQRRRKS